MKPIKLEEQMTPKLEVRHKIHLHCYLRCTVKEKEKISDDKKSDNTGSREQSCVEFSAIRLAEWMNKYLKDGLSF